MKLSTRSRYGVRLMVFLGERYGKGPIYLSEVAREEKISEKYLSQLVIPLRKVNLITSVRGARGGYMLSRPPQEISLREIVDVLEGGMDLVECVSSPETCSRRTLCKGRKLWTELSKRIANVLDDVTLLNLVKGE